MTQHQNVHVDRIANVVRNVLVGQNVHVNRKKSKKRTVHADATVHVHHQVHTTIPTKKHVHF